MPVARIISSSFEDALKFADYLRPLFDTVEIAQPGRASETPVDLEINLEQCTPEQAWRQVAEAGNQPDTDIFVAPGALVPAVQEQENWQGEEIAAKPADGAAALSGMQQEFETAGREVAAGLEQATSAAITAAGSNGSATHAIADASGTQAGLNWLGRARDSMRQWLQVRALLREIRQVEQERLEQEQRRQRQMALQFERERREREAQEMELARAAEKQLALHKAEQRRLRQEETRRLELEARQRRQAEEEKQREAEQALLRRQAEEEELQRQAEAEQLRRQAEQEEALRRGAFVEEILRRRAEEQAAQTAKPDATPEPVALPVESLPPEPVAPAVEPALAASMSLPRVNRLRPAMALAAFTSVLLTAVLLGYSHRRPASPLPLSVLQRSTSVEQKLPFGPAVVPAAASSAAPLVAVTSDRAESAAPLPEKHHPQSDFRRVRVGRHEVDYVSDDVTVRHFNTRARSQVLRHPASDVPVSASSRVKRISDME